jgi:thiol-disulfide isomerase/thioredoxin
MVKVVLLTGIFNCFIFFSLQAQEWPVVYNLKKIRAIELSSVNNKPIHIQPSEKLALFIFLSPECPLCKSYSVVLNKLAEDYAAAVDFFGIIPGKAYSADEVRTYQEKYRINFNLMMDKNKKLSTLLAATITPEVVLLDPEGIIIYRGAIDDWVVDLGKKKLKPEKDYLRTSLQQYTTHMPVLVSQTSPKGCYINEY